MNANDYVLTTKGKLGQIVLPGTKNLQTNHYEPASIIFNKKVYQIWPENLTVVSHIDIEVMGGTITLTAEKGSDLIKVLLRNKIPFKIESSTYIPKDMSEFEKTLFEL